MTPLASKPEAFAVWSGVPPEPPSAKSAVWPGLHGARGQAENLIKLHKPQLKSGRASCRSPLANPMRLILHTAACWLMLTVRDAVPKSHTLSKAEFAVIRAKLLKIGDRIRETTHRVRIAFAAACPEAMLFQGIAVAPRPAPRLTHGAKPRQPPAPSSQPLRRSKPRAT